MALSLFFTGACQAPSTTDVHDGAANNVRADAFVGTISDAFEIQLDGDVPCDSCPDGQVADANSCSCTHQSNCSNAPFSDNALCNNDDSNPESPRCVCNAGFFGDGTECMRHTICSPEEFEAA